MSLTENEKLSMAGYFPTLPLSTPSAMSNTLSETNKSGFVEEMMVKVDPTSHIVRGRNLTLPYALDDTLIGQSEYQSVKEDVTLAPKGLWVDFSA